MSDKRLYHSVAAKIVKLIDAGEFPPGSRLPAERELAERFNVSRVTVREAGIALDAQGRIEIRAGSGVYVRRASSDSKDDFPDVTAFDLTAARVVIESEAAALAASRANDADLVELDALVAKMSDPSASDETTSEADRLFHLAIARISGNPVVEYCVRQIWRMRDELPRVSEVYARICHDNTDLRDDEHMAILAALKKHDPAAARSAMHRHFHRLFGSMLEASEKDALAELRKRFQHDRERFQETTEVLST